MKKSNVCTSVDGMGVKRPMAHLIISMRMSRCRHMVPKELLKNSKKSARSGRLAKRKRKPLGKQRRSDNAKRPLLHKPARTLKPLTAHSPRLATQVRGQFNCHRLPTKPHSTLLLLPAAFSSLFPNTAAAMSIPTTRLRLHMGRLPSRCTTSITEVQLATERPSH